MEKIKLTWLIIILLSGVCFATRPPLYLDFTLSNVNFVNGHCSRGDLECDVSTSGNLNKKYTLTLMSNAGDNLCWWTLKNNGNSSQISTRILKGYTQPDIAKGVSIAVNYNRTTRGLWFSVASAEPTDPDDCGLCSYFYRHLIYSWDFENSMMLSVGNEYYQCSCTPWMGIPPWTAGLGGQATINSTVNFGNFADVTQDDNFTTENLAEFCEQWR